MATYKASVLNASEIIDTFEGIYKRTFHKANGLDLKGWVETFELWEESGISKNAFATLLVEKKYFDKVSTLNQNFGHINWAIEDNGLDVREICLEFSGMNEIRDARYPKTPKAPAIVNKAKGKFNAKVEASKYTEDQILAMLVAKKKG